MLRILSALLILLVPVSAHAEDLVPFKDELFAYPALLSQKDGYRVVDYKEARDINGRDEIPELRVKPAYVSAKVRKAQKDVPASGGVPAHIAVGKPDGARFITLYLHGKGGSRKQGADDYRFGGNFNRIKNLMAENGGLYVSPDFSDFGDKGAGEIAALIGLYTRKSPDAPVFVACGSMGGFICWRLAQMPDVAAKLGGLLLLGSSWDDDFAASPAFKARVPLFIGHGSKDPVFAMEKHEAFFGRIKAKSANYPVQLVRFESGTHGTPIRMSDWRETLNWMLSAR